MGAPVNRGSMERYWDRRAAEDPFHYVDNREPFKAPNVESFWRGGDEVVDTLLGELGITLAGDEDVLDVGCGIGRLTRALAGRTRSVTGLDVSDVMLGHARRLNPDLDNVYWVHGDGLTLRPLHDSSFDACVSFVVFQHLPDPELTYGYVREMGRVLRPGGWAAFQVSNDPRIHARAGLRRRAREQLLALTGRGPRAQGDRSWLGSSVDLDELRAAARDSGMALERVESQGTQFCLVLARRSGRVDRSSG